MAVHSNLKRRREDDKTPRRKMKIRKQKHYSSSSSSAEDENDNETFEPVDLAGSDSEGGSKIKLGTARLAAADQNAASKGLKSSRASTKSSSKTHPAPSAPSPSESEADSDADSDSDASSTSTTNSQQHLRSSTDGNKFSSANTTKRNDPARFATSMSAILSSKLSNSKRADPVLARSATAAAADADLANARLEAAAKQKLKLDRKTALEKGRVKDVLLGTDDPDVIGLNTKEEEGVGLEASMAEEKVDRRQQQQQQQQQKPVKGADNPDLEKQSTSRPPRDSTVRVEAMRDLEKKLRKTAQRGVVKLFNAVRQAQVRAEETTKEEEAKARRGIAGAGGSGIGKTRAQREEKVEEMSRQGFLEMVASGGAGGKVGAAKKMMGEKGRDIEEA